MRLLRPRPSAAVADPPRRHHRSFRQSRTRRMRAAPTRSFGRIISRSSPLSTRPGTTSPPSMSSSCDRVDLDPRIGGEVVQRELASDHEEAVVAGADDQGERPRLAVVWRSARARTVSSGTASSVSGMCTPASSSIRRSSARAPRAVMSMPSMLPVLDLDAGLDDDGVDAPRSAACRDLVLEPGDERERRGELRRRGSRRRARTPTSRPPRTCRSRGRARPALRRLSGTKKGWMPVAYCFIAASASCT